MCELLGEKVSHVDAATFFSVGLLSMLDAYFDKPLQTLISSMPLNNEVINALLAHSGNFGEVLETIIQLEQAQFSKIDWAFLGKYKIDANTLNDIQQTSLNWYRSSDL